MQAGFQLLRGLKMDRCKPHLLRLVDVGQSVIDEQTLLRGTSDFLEYDLEDLRVWFYMTYITRDDEVVEQIKEIIFFARKRKGFRGPVA